MVDEKIVEEVVLALLEQGELTKSQILETWGLGEENYKELQKYILKKNDSIEKGSQKIGGFVVCKRKRRFLMRLQAIGSCCEQNGKSRRFSAWRSCCNTLR